MNKTGSPKVLFVKTDPLAILPQYESKGAAGADIRARIDGNLLVNPMQTVLVSTGLKMEIPAGYECQVRPRSGLAAKYGITVLNSPGTIDSDYRGEIKVILINLGQEPYTIQDGDRIAQLVFAPVVQINIEESLELSDTSRGSGGFGSTGL
ncbi:MAG: dUTP diphosphatase [Treponema sp.]|jgi:dUTP pyrophosphatase|nr:dUTP diphosphatase [Treponema sp.]